MSLGIGRRPRKQAAGSFVAVTATIINLSRSCWKMASIVLRSSRYALQTSIRRPECHWPMGNSIRRIATTAPSGDASNLPLAGIKVLDMTRVLAGVRRKSRDKNLQLTSASHTAHKSSEILGTRLYGPTSEVGKPHTCIDYCSEQM